MVIALATAVLCHILKHDGILFFEYLSLFGSRGQSTGVSYNTALLEQRSLRALFKVNSGSVIPDLLFSNPALTVKPQTCIMLWQYFSLAGTRKLVRVKGQKEGVKFWATLVKMWSN